MMNDIRNILMPLNGRGDIDAALKLGLLYARRFKAHLSAILVGDDPNETAALAGEGLSGSMINEMMAASEHESQRRMLQMRLKFDAFIQENHLLGRSPTAMDDDSSAPEATASLEILTGAEHEAVTWRARLTDMTLMPHLAAADNARASETLHAVLFDSGRPLVIAPAKVPTTSGKRICIAWNGTAEAAAALRFVLPWTQNAEAVQVLTSPDYHRRGPAAEKVVAYLETHGVKASIRTFHAKDRNVGVGLLGACYDMEADMLAMGAYSHSRLRQMILGGVTRHVLENAELAVLMSR